MNSVDTLYHRKLAEKINELLTSKEDEILGGYGGNFSQVTMKYREGVGYVAALRRVIELGEQVERELMGGKQ